MVRKYWIIQERRHIPVKEFRQRVGIQNSMYKFPPNHWQTQKFQHAGEEHKLQQWKVTATWRRKWQLTPVFLPGKSHGQRSLAGYTPWGCKGVGHNLVTKQHWLVVTPVITRNKIIIIHVLIKEIQRACPFHHVRTQ